MDAAALTKEADALALAKAIDHMMVEALHFTNNNVDMAMEACAAAAGLMIGITGDHLELYVDMMKIHQALGEKLAADRLAALKEKQS